jgi:hypothetical protein
MHKSNNFNYEANWNRILLPPLVTALTYKEQWVTRQMQQKTQPLVKPKI